ncbi:hypothetical protein BH721_06800 [Clostridium baratii]|uniref:hypothetical protein n=1 Tax=Clostridium baratii TaxID=1561 RepID=UPI0009A2A902|nr:hypothetical protein [Clostridium baratii]OPF50810.1 hypothetical protein A1M12_08210 [Clostridium baratii]OPF54573.1 hypothetical protein BH721_06800 [Clostridium baratii]OPF54879.1 hypothetical protein BH724_01560 [Clostridium baratii]OPF59118.1 hypothetical protein BH725_10885 [Clostridium baratii]
MSSNECNDFEEFLKNFSASFDFGNENSTEEGCEDIKGGFQDLNPHIFPLTAELVGHVLASNLPFNVQNAIGNWFELLGQIILTYNSQQQYFQGGPGKYYDVRNKNIGNPYCTPGAADQADTNEGQDGITPASTSNISSSNKSSKNKAKYTDKDIESMKMCINTMLEKIDILTCEINNLKRQM